MATDPKSPTPESPTTARPLEMDDDDVQEASISLDDATTPVKSTSTAAAASGEAAGSGTTTPTKTDAAAATPAAAAATQEVAPPKPPRPLTEQQKKEQTLKEAFPTVDLAVVKAVLTASRGNIESAFHALLEMTDPTAVAHEQPDEGEPAPPPQPPRPSAHLQSGAAPAGRVSPNSQMMADEEYARQLAQHYEIEAGQYEARTSSGRYGGGRSAHGGPPYPPRSHSSRDGSLKPNEMWGDKDHSFLDDDLPVIRENLRKGFVETQTKFNNWFTGIKKKIDEEWNVGDDEADDDSPGGARRQRKYEEEARLQQAGRGGYGGAFGRPPPRRSGDYDADPELLSDDFAGIQLHGDGTPVRNPNLFRPPPSTSPRPSSGRKVAFRDEEDTIDAYGASPKLSAKDGSAAGGAAAAAASGAKASKWQPMSSVDPTPLADHDDPFSLGDSEDEKDTTTASKPAGGKSDAGPAAAKTSTSSASGDEAERLRKAAAEAMADSLVEDKPKA